MLSNYNAKDKWWYSGEEIVPVYYEAQGRHYMCVMNINRVYFCCLYGNNEDEVIIRHMERDLSYEEELIALEDFFWHDNVLAKNPPPYTESGDLIMESLRRSFGPSVEDMAPISITSSQFSRVARYLELQAEKSLHDAVVKHLESEMKRLKALIAADMGKNRKAAYADEHTDYTITLSSSRTPKILKPELERLKELHPDIYDQYVTMSESSKIYIKRAAHAAA